MEPVQPPPPPYRPVGGSEGDQLKVRGAPRGPLSFSTVAPSTIPAPAHPATGQADRDAGQVRLSTLELLRGLLNDEYGDEGWEELRSLQRIAKAVDDHFAARQSDPRIDALLDDFSDERWLQFSSHHLHQIRDHIRRVLS